MLAALSLGSLVPRGQLGQLAAENSCSAGLRWNKQLNDVVPSHTLLIAICVLVLLGLVAFAFLGQP